MPIDLINPPELVTTPMYAQVSVARGSRLVHVAGQQAVDAQGAKIGTGDLAAQVEQALLNVAAALAAVGAGFDDVAKLTVYVTEWTPARISAFLEGFGRGAARAGITAAPPVTVVGVTVLFDPDFLVEIEATAVLA